MQEVILFFMVTYPVSLGEDILSDINYIHYDTVQVCCHQSNFTIKYTAMASTKKREKAETISRKQMVFFSFALSAHTFIGSARCTFKA